MKPHYVALSCTLLCGLSFSAAAQSGYTLLSPNGRIEVRVRAEGRIRYDVTVNGATVIRDATMSINIDRNWLGRNIGPVSATERSVDQVLHPVVREQSAVIPERYSELRLETGESLTVDFRAYNEGIAYRLETSLPNDEVHVYEEEMDIPFAGDYNVFYPEEESFFSHNERMYTPRKLSEIPGGTLASLPAVVDANGVKIAIADSDIEGYPGLWLSGTGGSALTGTFPPYPLQERLLRDRNLHVTEAADYIAITGGTRTFPWRLFGIAEDDGDLLTNSLPWLLASPSRIEDTSWIQPGKVAWDWWNHNNIYGVDFEAGINNQTYKYYIDFASKYGLEYIILDEGWYELGNVLSVVPEIDVAELIAYGREKNVGIILWVVWKTLADQMEPALDQFAEWGVKGIKVDFMQRDDQPIIDFYHHLAREAAERHLLLDFHGGQKPAMMTRTWPNIISTEGVRGMETDKWDTAVDPTHDVTLAFTRMFLGPMDYTPGAMLNTTKETFAPIFNHPMAMGTRAHQLAMYVVYESPLQMLADSPSNYLREPEAMEFLGPVPSVWDETRVLEAKIAEYVVVARRSGSDWYIGAMTDWSPRDLELDLSFLGSGDLTMESYEDGPNAHRMAGDYKLMHSSINRESRPQIHLAPGGGWAARIHR